jgi:pantoate--beta-alanine ligase
MYPNALSGQAVWVEPGELADDLCGASRPGHFRGVATVVAKLLNIVQPDRAYFGQKDGQQAVIITRMVEDLAFRSAVRVLPTVREPDGLALSSRNVYLTPEERRQATALCRALLAAREAILAGERETGAIESIMKRTVAERAPLGRLDYARVVDLSSLQPVPTLDHDALIALAVYFGKARLIDNTVLRYHEGRVQFS